MFVLIREIFSNYTSSYILIWKYILSVTLLRSLVFHICTSYLPTKSLYDILYCIILNKIFERGTFFICIPLHSFHITVGLSHVCVYCNCLYDLLSHYFAKSAPFLKYVFIVVQRSLFNGAAVLWNLLFICRLHSQTLQPECPLYVYWQEAHLGEKTGDLQQTHPRCSLALLTWALDAWSSRHYMSQPRQVIVQGPYLIPFSLDSTLNTPQKPLS